MQVTDVRMKLFNNERKMKAVSSVTFDNEFVVHDVKVIENEDNLFIAFPSKKDSEGNFSDICHPISQAMRKKVQDAVLAKYEEELKAQEGANE